MQHDIDDLPDDVSGNAEESADDAVHDGRADGRLGVRRTDGEERGEVEMDTPPSNTVSNNCNNLYYKLLRFGVDSLYLSYPGELKPDVEDNLKALKKVAQSPEPYQRIGAQYQIWGHLFEVLDKGAQLFPYILEDNCFRIQLSRGGKVPMAYVKVSSEYLTHVGPFEAEKTLRTILDKIGTIQDQANVSRIDLFADFSSNVDMESWGRRAWVTRASSVNSYSVNDQFSGWAIGLGGPVAARLYDKILEVQKSEKVYLFDLWKQGGWEIDEPVLRLEFEIKREILAQLGPVKLRDVLPNLNGLWSYAMTDWLKLTLPSETDKTRSRWPIHPLWAFLSSIDWETSGGPLTRQFSPARIPGDDKLFGMGFSYIVSFMAREGILDITKGIDAFIEEIYMYQERKSYDLGMPFDKYVEECVRIKARHFNSILNPQSGEVLDKVFQAGVEAYRKASDGE